MPILGDEVERRNTEPNMDFIFEHLPGRETLMVERVDLETIPQAANTGQVVCVERHREECLSSTEAMDPVDA